MKVLHLFIFLTLTSFCFGQSKDVEIIKTENGNEITYSAKSISRETIILEFNVTGNGFKTSVSLPTKIELKSFEKKEVVKITTEGASSYNVSYKIMKGGNLGSMSSSSGAESDRPELNKGIVVFSKDGCGKCTFAKTTLTQKGKTFTELNISKNEADQNFMWKKLQDAGFAGGSVQTPVIMIDGKVHYNMDLKLFLADIK